LRAIAMPDLREAEGSREHADHLDRPAIEGNATADNIGIPAEAIPRLFTKFFRVHGEQTDEIPGTGLGLALVTAIARLHGGAARAFNQDGHGVRFEVDLPGGTGS